ncbi:MAG: OprO/OprP family phosphate-selective porin [Pirellulales bacterium]|nr:OprO/OprP family phosphate-selective porin [Pirellulales bacterium]
MTLSILLTWARPGRTAIVARRLCETVAILVAYAGLPSADAADRYSMQPLPPADGIQAVAFYDNSLKKDANGDNGEDEADKKKPTIEERIANLEDSYSDLGDNYNKLTKENKGLKKKLKALAATGHGEATMKVNGRIHADMWTFPDSDAAINVFESGNPTVTPQDRVGFRRMRFGVKGNIWKTMLYKIEMEFAGGNDSQFRDVYLGWKEVPFFQKVLLGNQKRPYGLDHLNSSRYNVFLERPFFIESFNQDCRRFGLQSWGVSEDQAWNWRYGVFNQHLMQASGQFASDHWQAQVAGRMANTFWYDEASGGRGYGHWAVSGTHAKPDGSAIPGRAPNEARFRHRPEARSAEHWLSTGRITGAADYQLLGLENVWNFGSLQLVGEYQNIWLQRDPGTVGGDSDLQFNGAYMYAAYFLTGEHMPWNRSSGQLDRIKPLENFFLVDTCSDGIQGGWGAWQVAYRISYADFNDDNIFGGRGLSHTLGLNWYWNAYSRMQLNAIYGEINDAAVSDGDNTRSVGATSPGDILSGNYTILGMRFMVDF